MDPLTFVNSPLGLTLITVAATLMAAVIMAPRRAEAGPSQVIEASPGAIAVQDNSRNFSVTMTENRTVVHAPTGATADVGEDLPVPMLGMAVIAVLTGVIWMLATHWAVISIAVPAALAIMVLFTALAGRSCPSSKEGALHGVAGAAAGLVSAWGVMSLGQPVPGVPDLAQVAAATSEPLVAGIIVGTWQTIFPDHGYLSYALRLAGLCIALIVMVGMVKQSVGYLMLGRAERIDNLELYARGMGLIGGRPYGVGAFVWTLCALLLAVLLMHPDTFAWVRSWAQPLL